MTGSSAPTAFVDTVEPDGQRRSWWLGRPVETWEAQRVDEVRDALHRVESAQRAGLTVAGAIGYEAAPAFDSALATFGPGTTPLAFFAAYEDAVMDPAQVSLRRWSASGPPRFPPGARQGFVRGVHAVLEHIARGDVYQVNLTARAEVPVVLRDAEQTWAAFLALRAATRAPHAAFLAWSRCPVLSLSPELFLRRRGTIVESAPMKGTAPRHADPAFDGETRRWLAADPKTRAENLMIVDLMRNDLGRVCRPASVEVPELWTVTPHPTLFQMTSLVRGELEAGVGLVDILEATFPPGSVTGAPKVRAMQIIRDLEDEPRSVYCGAVGVFHPGGDLDLSVAIRTIEISDRGTLHLGLGAGIVADSQPEDEWNETVLKGSFVNREPFGGQSVDADVQGLTRRIP